MHWKNYSGKCRKAEKNKFPSKEEFIADFEWYMHRHRESFTKNNLTEEWNTDRKYWQIIMINILTSFNKIVAIERNIRNVVIKDVPLKGKLDKLEFDGKDP